MLLVVLTTVACGDSEAAGSADTWTEHDSAGIQIVHSARANWRMGDHWRVRKEPRLEIGGGGRPESEFQAVTAAIRGGRGEILVADGGVGELHVFDSSGGYVRTLGRRGQGPGEFTRLLGLLRLGPDTVVAFDYDGYRISVFNLADDAAFAGSTRLEEPPLRADGRRLYLKALAGRFGTGELVALPGAPLWFGRVPGVFEDTVVLPVYTPDGRLARTLGPFRLVEMLTTSDRTAPRPFGRSTSFAVGGAVLYVGLGHDYEIRRYDPDGTLVALIRRDFQPRAVGREEIARFVDHQLGGMSSGAREAYRGFYEKASFPAQMPPYARLLLDPEEHLWVERFAPPWEQGPRQWDVFDPRGAYLGEVEVPADVEVTEIGFDYVLGVTRDAMDAERVVLHRLERGRAALGRS